MQKAKGAAIVKKVISLAAATPKHRFMQIIIYFSRKIMIQNILHRVFIIRANNFVRNIF